MKKNEFINWDSEKVMQASWAMVGVSKRGAWSRLGSGLNHSGDVDAPSGHGRVAF